MKQYKGLYIDKVIFNSEAEIDAFFKEQAINDYKTAVEVFAINHTMEASILCDDKAGYLVENFGLTWEEVEQIEIDTLKAIA